MGWSSGRGRLLVLPACVVALVLLMATAVASAADASCSPRDSVFRVAAAGDHVYAQVLGPGLAWARSADGRSWETSGPPPGAALPAPTDTVHGDPAPAGPTEACGPHGVCWQVNDRRTIQRIHPDGTVSDAVRLTAADRSELSTGCANADNGVLDSVVVQRDGTVVASLGAGGVLVHEPGGGWDRVPVLGARSPESATGGAPTAAVLLFGPLLALAVVGTRRLLPSWTRALGVVAAGAVGVLVLAGLFSVVDIGRGRSDVLIVLAMVLTVLVAVAVGRITRQGDVGSGSQPGAPQRRSEPPVWFGG